MVPLATIIDFLDAELEIDGFEDHCPNGLQVPSHRPVSTVATGVSASLELIDRARDAGAELVLAHHGLFWDFHSRALTPGLARRLSVLLGEGIALAGYHLPLDAHPRLGNNALLADGLGLRERRPFGVHRGRALGVVGRLPDAGLNARGLVAQIEDLTGREALWLDCGPDTVETLGIVSGAAASDFRAAIAAGLDAFLTGEPAEHVTAEAREAGVHFIAAGHHATETFGVRALGDLLAQRFDVGHVHIDVPNPI